MIVGSFGTLERVSAKQLQSLNNEDQLLKCILGWTVSLKLGLNVLVVSVNVRAEQSGKTGMTITERHS